MIPALAVATVLYYFVCRWLQDHLLPIDSSAILHVLSANLRILPEPYEILLYFFGYLAIPLIAWWLCRFFRWSAPVQCAVWAKIKRPTVIGIGVAAVVLGVAVAARQWLPLFSQGVSYVQSYFQTHSLWHLGWLLTAKRLYAIRIIMSFGLVVFFVSAWRFPHANFSWLRARLHPRFLARVEWLFPFVLAALLFDPMFSYDRGHYNFVLGTVNDMIHGKAFLYETTNQYGVLNAYLVAWLFKYVVPLSYAAFSAVLMVGYFTFFVVLYYVLKSWMGSRMLALLGTAGGLAVYVYLQSGMDRTAYNFPGTTPYRQGWFVVVAAALLMVVQHKRWQKWWQRDLPLYIAALATIWNIDAGVAVMAAVLASVTVVEIQQFEKLWILRLRRIFGAYARQAAYLAAGFGVIHIANRLIFGSWPNWKLVADAISVYGTGAARLPLPAVGMFEGYILVYTVAALVVVRRAYRRQAVDPLFVFFLGYGILSFTYYIGTSAWSYLYPVSIPLVVVALYLFYDLYLRPGITRGPAEPFAARVFVALLAAVALTIAIKIPLEFSKRDYRNIPSRFTLEANIVTPELISDAKRIANEFPAGTRVALAHVDDTQLLIAADRTNIFSIYNSETIGFDWQYAAFADELRVKQPSQLLVGKQYFIFRPILLRTIATTYQRTASWQTLDVYERKLPSPR